MLKEITLDDLNNAPCFIHFHCVNVEMLMGGRPDVQTAKPAVAPRLTEPRGSDKLDSECSKVHFLQFVRPFESGIPLSSRQRRHGTINAPEFDEALGFPQLFLTKYHPVRGCVRVQFHAICVQCRPYIWMGEHL
jgi:hypothetical protein